MSTCAQEKRVRISTKYTGVEFPETRLVCDSNNGQVSSTKDLKTTMNFVSSNAAVNDSSNKTPNEHWDGGQGSPCVGFDYWQQHVPPPLERLNVEARVLPLKALFAQLESADQME
ncbi:hypothetical protein CEXT_169211 [Caerostris extrusa]|uniref:Uncharacterized protein n=1 Tax=Caerostris extrusa TaxID=172846 RepID=A0AAV4VLP7_CAEEX|nr:hypothetical protein CEXT_169211 [Caerostris extrusa]